jgi:hypothetical protein
MSTIIQVTLTIIVVAALYKIAVPYVIGTYGHAGFLMWMAVIAAIYGVYYLLDRRHSRGT